MSLAEKRQDSGQSSQQSAGQSQSQTQSAAQSGQTTTQSLASQTSLASTPISPNAPPGIITVTQPPQQSTTFYEIAQNAPITFAWEYSDLIVTPTHLTISAVCENGNTYPVGPTDGIISGAATSVIWDAYAYQTSHPQLPLVQAKYTLEIWGDQGPDAPRTPGFLAPNSAVQFALYTAQGYTPVASGWNCPACSGAISRYDAALVGWMITLLVMFLSGSFLMRRR